MSDTLGHGTRRRSAHKTIGWVVLSGHTRIQDPYVNFRHAFAGSSHSSNDVGHCISFLMITVFSTLAVRYCDIQSFERLCRVVECELCLEQRKKTGTDLEDRGTSWAWHLCGSISACQRRLLRVSDRTQHQG